jgi:uncharacterized protein (TIGR03118 family)
MSTILTNLRIRQARPVAAAAFVALTLEACGGHNNPPPMPTVTLSVSPTTITVGQSATLTWSSTNAVSCAASGTGTGTGWTGNEQLMGTATDTPPAAATVTYTITCTGAAEGGGYGGGGGAQTATANATLTVTAPPPTAFVVKWLVADGAGVAATQDTNLVNAWGLVFAPNDPVWIANNATNTSTLYDGNGAIEPSAAQPLVVALPAATDGTGAEFKPTGIVAFTTGTQFPNDFKVTAGGKTGQAVFIYSGQGGQLAGWSPAVSLTQAVSAYAAKDKACYRGLAIANNGTANYLYANDFLNGKIDVFDATWAKQSTSAFPFADPNMTADYAPFNIQAIPNGPGGATQLYVSYAKAGSGANQGTCEDTRGAGFGAINVFDANGKLVTELVKVGGLLNAPWGMALSKSFGTLSNALLVSNHADGMINGYDPVKGTWIGTLQTSAGAFAQPGLWGIAFGNDGMTTTGVSLNQPSTTLFFTAGPNEAANGLYGRIDLPAK